MNEAMRTQPEFKEQFDHLAAVTPGRVYSMPDEIAKMAVFLASDDGLPMHGSMGDETILVIEDDPDVRMFVVSALRVLGYTILEAHDGPEALALLEDDPHIDMLLTDVVLPRGMNGRVVADEVLKRYPQIKVLFSSGYTENAIVHHGRLDVDAELLSKPYTRETLATRVRSILDS